MKANVCITGVARGIGHALTKVFLQEGYRVFGTVRDVQALPVKKLQEFDLFTPLQADLREKASLAAACRSMQESVGHLDILVNNAAIMSPLELSGDGDLDPKALEEVFAVNVSGQLAASLAFKPLLKTAKEPIIANITSVLGSLALLNDYKSNGTADGYITPHYAYAVSKAALNMLTRLMGRKWGIRTFCIHPGWVQTDMGGSNAALTPGESASGLFKQITSWNYTKPEFIDFQGNTISW